MEYTIEELKDMISLQVMRIQDEEDALNHYIELLEFKTNEKDSKSTSNETAVQDAS